MFFKKNKNNNIHNKIYNKINKKFILLSIFGIFIVSGILFYFLTKNNGETPVHTVVEKNKTEEKSSCNINLAFLYKTSFIEHWEKKTIIKKQNDIKNKKILNCSKLLEKDKNLLSVVKSFIPSYVEYNINNNSIIYTGLNKNYIKNSLKENYIGDKDKIFFKYKEKDPFIVKFERLLKGYKNIADIKQNIKKISGIEKIKYGKLFKKYGNNIIITNYKFYLDINPAEKHLLAKLSNDDSFQNLIDLEVIFNNAFIENDIYIILKDIDKILK